MTAMKTAAEVPEQHPASLIGLWNKGWPETPSEFGELVDVFQHRLVRYAFRRMGSIEDAEDAIQHVFVKAFQNRHKLKSVRQVGPYLYRMAANACIDLIRKRGRRNETTLNSLDESPVSIVLHDNRESIQAVEESRRIESLLCKLPQRQAEAVRLRVFDELSFQEIAEVFGCSEATAKSRFRYGLEKVKRLIRKEWGYTQ